MSMQNHNYVPKTENLYENVAKGLILINDVNPSHIILFKNC
jgi:hypothetical protein